MTFTLLSFDLDLAVLFSVDDTDGEKPSSPPAWAVHAAERRAKLAKRGLIKLDDDEIDS